MSLKIKAEVLSTITGNLWLFGGGFDSATTAFSRDLNEVDIHPARPHYHFCAEAVERKVTSR